MTAPKADRGSFATIYFVVVAALTLVLPVASIAVDFNLHPGASALALVGKWFTFWSVGVRLLIAGLRQIVQPRYTAQVILGLAGEESLVVVRELGFANIAISAVGICSLAVPAWVPAGALAGGIFYALAGVNHAMRAHRNANENVAMASDLLVAAVLLVYSMSLAIRQLLP
jgi:hypothetical protein